MYTYTCMYVHFGYNLHTVYYMYIYIYIHTLYMVYYRPDTLLLLSRFLFESSPPATFVFCKQFRISNCGRVWFTHICWQFTHKYNEPCIPGSEYHTGKLFTSKNKQTKRIKSKLWCAELMISQSSSHTWYSRFLFLVHFLPSTMALQSTQGQGIVLVLRLTQRTNLMVKSQFRSCLLSDIISSEV